MHPLPQTFKENFAICLKKNKFEKISGRGLAFEDLQTVHSRLGKEGFIAILAQPPSSSDDRHYYE